MKNLLGLYSLEIKRRLIPFLTLIYLFLFQGGFAQEPDDAISVHALNERYLEHLVKIKIDSVRLAHNLTTLHNDSILYLAAKFHANYLFKRGELDHNEPENPKTKTPQKRAEYFGAVNYLVGENILFTFVNIPTKGKKGKASTNSTYNQTATDIAIAWVNSPAHYKNMITPEYNATGVAVWVDKTNNRVYAVQKFANILFRYTFPENKTFFSYSDYVPPPVVNSFEGIDNRLHRGRHAHRLKTARKESQCNRCYGSIDSTEGLSRIEYRNGKIYYTSYDLLSVLNMLKHKKDGFAVEVVYYNPYDCGNPAYYTNPSRRNGQCVFSGVVLKPVYRKKALAGFRAGANRKKIEENIGKNKVKKYEVKLGSIPKQMLTNYQELNLVVIQKKRVCRVMKFSGYCGDTLERFYTLPVYYDSVPSGGEIREEYRNVSFKIPFEKGKTNYNIADIKPLTDSLISKSFTADSVIIKAYSSVEGSTEINKKIQEERSRNISRVLSSLQREKLTTVIVSEENWELFEIQTEKNENLKQFRGLSREKIKQLLEDTILLKKVEPFLKEQRVAHLRMKARDIITDQNLEQYLNRRVSQIKKSVLTDLADQKRKDLAFPRIDSLKFLMSVAYTAINKEILQPGFFKIFKVVGHEQLNDYNELRTKYLHQLLKKTGSDSVMARQLYDELVSLYNNKKQSFFINYNMLNNIQRFGKLLNVSIQESQAEAYVQELRLLASDSMQLDMVEKLGVNFWFVICRETREETPRDKHEMHDRCMSNIYYYFKEKKLGMEEKNRLAAYYVYHMRMDWAYELLWPDYENKVNNPEGLKVLAKILYQNYEETNNIKYYDFLKEVYERIGAEQWCPMFIGPCNISFQVLDYEEFRNFYCEKCGNFLNYAKAP